MAIECRNPATGELIASYEPLDAQAIERRIALAAATFRAWRQTTFGERTRMLTTAAALLEANADRLGRLMTIEMGKLTGAARDEILKCARGCRYYAQHGPTFLADETADVSDDAARAYIRYEPLGPIFAIMPWNFPFWQVFRFAAPALAAGNVVLLKHAPNVPQCALAIEAVFKDAGCPEGAFQSLLLEVEQVPPILADDRIKAVTLTGSDRAGRDVASRAGRALKKSVLELGGSDPFIVMPSANMAQAVATAVKSRTINSGQSCIAAKRFIVDAAVAEEFTDRFVKGMAALKIGDPLDPSTEIGPMARSDLVETLSAQVGDALARGAKRLTGDAPVGSHGCFYPPTVLVDIPKQARVYREEVFGPVAMVFTVTGVDEAIALANDTPYGLGASVWTNDPVERDRFVDRLEAGQVFVNAMVASDPRVPFGGVKMSGYGRELGEQGIREFVQAKTVWVGKE
jgi:succinate-semialdehyde dehydrogenase / glutarate-semialdehyde dehydrogenase